MVNPILKHRFVSFIEKDEFDTNDMNYAISAIVAMISFEILLKFEDKWAESNQSRMGKITVGSLKAMIFNKNSTMSSSAKKQYTTS